MARVSDIQRQVKRADRFSIFLDEEFWLGIPAELIGELAISVGDQLDPEAIERAELRVGQHQAMQAAGDLLGYRARSQKELEKRLSERGLSPKAVEYAIQELERYGYVDDDDFSAQLIAGQRYKGRGRMSARFALVKAGVAEEQISSAMECHYPEEAELEVAYEWARSRFRPNDPERLRRQLNTRGFNWETVNQVLERLSEPES